MIKSICFRKCGRIEKIFKSLGVMILGNVFSISEVIEIIVI